MKRFVILFILKSPEANNMALDKMKVKASRTSDTVLEMLLASDNLGIERMTNLFNQIVAKKYQKIAIRVQL